MGGGGFYKDYANGLFGCFKDIPTCIYGIFCFYCLNSFNTAKATNASFALCHLCAPAHPFVVRKNAGGGSGCISDLGDCIIADICCPCAVCQDARKYGSGFQQLKEMC